MSRLFDHARKETWTGRYLVLGRLCQLEPAFTKVGSEYIPVLWHDSQEVEFLKKSWFAEQAVSV